MSAEPTTENKELAKLLAPFMGQTSLFNTPQFVAGVEFIITKLTAEFEKQFARCNFAEEAKYLPADKLAKRYGFTSTKGIDPYLLGWRISGEVEWTAPIHPATGRRGRKIYLVADVDRMMKNLPKNAKK